MSDKFNNPSDQPEPATGAFSITRPERSVPRFPFSDVRPDDWSGREREDGSFKGSTGIQGAPVEAQQAAGSPLASAKVNADHLNVGTLRSVARAKLNYAMSVKHTLEKESAMARAAIIAEARASIEGIEAHMRARLEASEAEFRKQMQPAVDMINLVEKMLT